MEFAGGSTGDYGGIVTTTLETEPTAPDEVEPADPDEEDARQGDRGPAPEEPIPAEAPEVPADEPKEG